MPPRFTLTPRQTRALQVLEWLESDDERGTGRSTVLALHYLRRLVFNFSNESEGAWLSVHDHVASNQAANRHVAELVVNLALELRIQVERRGERIRLQPGEPLPVNAREELSTFHERPEEALVTRMQRRPSRPISFGPTILDEVMATIAMQGIAMNPEAIMRALDIPEVKPPAETTPDSIWTVLRED